MNEWMNVLSTMWCGVGESNENERLNNRKTKKYEQKKKFRRREIHTPKKKKHRENIGTVVCRQAKEKKEKDGVIVNDKRSERDKRRKSKRMAAVCYIIHSMHRPKIDFHICIKGKLHCMLFSVMAIHSHAQARTDHTHTDRVAKKKKKEMSEKEWKNIKTIEKEKNV